MFERFTDRARRVVILAQEEAKLLNHNYVGTEHIVLGLIHEGEGVAAQALLSLGVSLDGARDQVLDIIGKGQQEVDGQIPFTPRVKKALELAFREALQLGHTYIGTEHILLGVIREGEGIGAQVLVHLGADLPRTRQKVIELLRGDAIEAPPTAIPLVVSFGTSDALSVKGLSISGEHHVGGRVTVQIEVPDPAFVIRQVSFIVRDSRGFDRTIVQRLPLPPSPEKED